MIREEVNSIRTGGGATLYPSALRLLPAGAAAVALRPAVTCARSARVHVA